MIRIPVTADEGVVLMNCHSSLGWEECSHSSPIRTSCTSLINPCRYPKNLNQKSIPTYPYGKALIPKRVFHIAI